jgi:CAP12/Pycsar effector protein, TIR domain
MTSPQLSGVPHTRPTVFIGSSFEGLSVAQAIQYNFDVAGDYETKIWNQLTLPGETLIATLTRVAQTYDFAILVVTPDDVRLSRGTREECPRDNVLLEIGLFMGAVGWLRTFLVADRTARTKLPSDLAGVTYAEYTPPTSADLRSALGPACYIISLAMKEQGRRGLIPGDLLKDLVEILNFAKVIHTGFQALDTSHLDSLREAVYDLVTGRVNQESRPGKSMESDNAWKQYKILFRNRAAHFNQFLGESGWDRLDSAFVTLDENVSPDVKPQIETCRDFFGLIKGLLPEFMAAHTCANEILGDGKLSDIVNNLGQNSAFSRQLDCLSDTAKKLITQADAMIVNTVNLISIQSR